jgi:eukaryotic-like serine/threonine-protein kinase
MTTSSTETLLLPRQGRRTSASQGGTPTGLPPDLLTQAAARLRIMAWLYAGAFFMAGYFPALFSAEARAQLFGSVILWSPGVISIIVAVGVALALRSAAIPAAKVMAIGLVFEVVSSYGIAASEFLGNDMFNHDIHWLGLSWVGVWVVLFTVVIPTPPKRAVAAALVSITAVPIMVLVMMREIDPAHWPNFFGFFFGLIFPYLLIVGMAYVGARVVYALGTEVTRARELGSYRLVERLGQGGMGEVWRAKHRLLARPAAIKLIRPQTGTNSASGISEEAQRRFEREAQAIALLRSPHTVNLFDFGIADDGAFYYVMELLDGLDTDRLVKRTGPLPAERAIHVLTQVCHSLSEAESCGLVHRDIKPANIFLCRYGEDVDFVKVLDFGIVKATNDSTSTDVALTREMSVQGTPAFIAPEQALGGTQIDGRADIYATGCVAYWLLTGQHVFEGESAMALLMHHARTTPSPPSSRTELPIPRGLDELVLACLAKDPAARPQTARELSRGLARVSGTAPWTDDRARAWWDQHLPAKGTP